MDDILVGRSPIIREPIALEWDGLPMGQIWTPETETQIVASLAWHLAAESEKRGVRMSDRESDAIAERTFSEYIGDWDESGG